MVKLRILKKSSKSRARLGILKTRHGEVETPTLVTVATQATVKTLTVDQAKAAGSRLLICNTFHLHLKPGEKVVKAAGGLHEFMRWKGPLMTDSGGYQVFSLGFGRDFGVGKIQHQRTKDRVAKGHQPKLLKITEDGVTFTSYLDGSKIFMGPEESMKIQAALGADIIFAFDECPPTMADRAYSEESLARTHRWAKRSLDAHDPKQALFGVVQGGKYKDLRALSAKTLAAMPFDGFGIGGEFGYDKSTMTSMLRTVMKELPDAKPRHLLGIGHPQDILRIIKEGVDTFDCTVPTQYARHGTAFTSRGRLEIGRSVFLKDKKPLDPTCDCMVCAEYSRSYLCHLYRAKESLAGTLLTYHNLAFFNRMVAEARKMIKRGLL
jgi:queuine tRNA-ribosyltransferase